MFDEERVLWAIANRFQADRGLVVITGAQGSELDPSAGPGGVNAKDRIGTGPGKNQKGKLIASSVAELHGAAFNVLTADNVDEKGAAVPIAGPNRHDIVTGTNRDGTATATNNCANWTSSAANTPGPTVGHSDSETTAGMANDAWNNAHVPAGCSQQQLNQVGGEGRFYCFAVD